MTLPHYFALLAFFCTLSLYDHCPTIPTENAYWLMWRSADNHPNQATVSTDRNELMRLYVKGICAGKHAIAEHLIQYQGFQLLELVGTSQSQPESCDDLRLQASEIKKKDDPKSLEFTFQDPDSLLDFATKRWQERWVTTDIADANTLDRFLLRPFFLLVSVDAPVSLRWKRFADRFVIYAVDQRPKTECFPQVLEKATGSTRP